MSPIADGSIFEDEGAIDTFLVANTLDYTQADTSTDLHSRLRRRAQQTRRHGSGCTGAFFMAPIELDDGFKGYDDADIIIR